MANLGAIVTEDIRKTIAIGQSVYDNEGAKVGTIDMVDDDTGYFKMQLRPLPEKRDNPLAPKTLYVPFRLITNIDPRELFVSVSNDELRRDYADPPLRSTAVVDVDGTAVDTTTEPDGYTGAPVVVDKVRLDELKKRIAVGDHVYTSELTDLGKIKQYDSQTGWMLVERGALSEKHETMVPVTVIADVNQDSHEVYLVVSQADLDRMDVEPASVVFVDGGR